MKNHIRNSPSLGLYLALIWVSIAALPIALFDGGLRQLFQEVRETWKEIGARHG